MSRAEGSTNSGLKLSGFRAGGLTVQVGAKLFFGHKAAGQLSKISRALRRALFPAPDRPCFEIEMPCDNFATTGQKNSLFERIGPIFVSSHVEPLGKNDLGHSMTRVPPVSMRARLIEGIYMNAPNKLQDRIREGRRARKLTQRALAPLVERTPQTVSFWETGRTIPKLAELRRVAEVLKLSLEWLVDGTGDRDASDVIKSQQLRGTTIPTLEFEKADRHPITHLADLYGEGLFYLEVKNAANAPDFIIGDEVIVSKQLPPQPGDYVVAVVGDDGSLPILRRYRSMGSAPDGTETIELVPLNKDWPTVRIDGENPGRIIGLAVEMRRYFRK